MAKKWNYADAKYKKKKVGSYVIEMDYSFERGGEIRIHHKYVDETIHFMHGKNALQEYNQMKSVKEIFSMIRRNT